jgi:tetratricopeptide (TPR) repeat protein
MGPLRTSLTFVTIGCLALHAWAIDPPGRKPPTKEEIAQWIRQLGSDRFGAREEASRKLWDAGQAAEDAVAAASKDEDIEVRRRASELHDKFRWGIYPDTPKAVVELIKRYKDAEMEQRSDLPVFPLVETERSALIRSFLEQGVPGSLSLKKIVRADPDKLPQLLERDLRRAMPALLEKQQYAVVENVLDIALDLDFKLAINHYTAWWLLRGRINERIAYHTKLEGKGNQRQAEILAYLHRAKGDMPSALAAARRSGDDHLIDTMLFEMAAWEELALRGNALGVSLQNDTQADQLVHRATFRRLAGNSAAALDTFEEMRRYEKTLPRHDRYEHDIIAKAFFINDMSDDAVKSLKMRRVWIPAYAVLVARFRFAEADALVSKAREEGYPRLAHLEAMQASTWCLLGNKEKALPVFARQAEKLQKEMTDDGLADLVEEEMRAGLTDLAFEHAGAVLDAKGGYVCSPDILFHLFPARERTKTAYTLHYVVLATRGKSNTFSSLLKLIRQLLVGKASQKEVIALLDAGISGVEGSTIEPSWIWEALAEVASLAGLEEADSVDSLIRLGDRRASKKQWEAAARCYQKAWNKQYQFSLHDYGRPGYPLALYLYGHALVQGGHYKEGEEAMLNAHWLPLGSATDRYEFALELLKRGYIHDSQRENEMVLHSGDMCRTKLIRGNALSRKDYLTYAAALQEDTVWKLFCSENRLISISWRGRTALLSQSASIHRYRALSLISSGKAAEAVREAELALAILPSNLDPAIDLIPELEGLGRKDEATGLYRRSRAAVEQLCKEYPRSAIFHNEVAWLSACCRRDLDAALVHARKAVEFAPEVARYQETLAEIYFQLGHKDRAMETLKKAQSLSLQSLHFQKQLERLAAGDTKAPRPPQDKEDDD